MSDDYDDERREDIDIYDPETRKPRICAHECATCIMNPDSPLRKGPGRLRPGRLPEMLREVKREQGYVVCHSTFGPQAAICRGVADIISPQILRIAYRLGGVIEIDPDKKESKP